MHFTILSIFPEFFQGPLDCGLLGRARNEGLVSFDLVNPREYTTDRHRSVDDRPYGGGPGMVMALPPL
ncbi:MAG: tRNA (guanine(37)-N(1))-methyltransferase, partial [Desulfovibrionales bacterium]